MSCRGRDSPGKNRREERYLAAHISRSVKAARHLGGHVSVSRLMPRPSPGTTRDILEQESARARAAIRLSSLLYVCVCVRARARFVTSHQTHTHTRAKVCRTSGNAPSAVDCMMDAVSLT